MGDSTITRANVAAPQNDYVFAAAAAMAAQDEPEPQAPAATSDKSKVAASKGKASSNVAIADAPAKSSKSGKPAPTQADYDAVAAEHKKDAQMSNKIAAVTMGAFGVGTAVQFARTAYLAKTTASVVKAVNVAKTASGAVSATKVVAGAAKSVGVMSKVGGFLGKAIPVLGIVSGGVGVGFGVANWNSEGNKKKGDDVARIAGDALTTAGSVAMLIPGGQIVGLGLLAAGLISSGIGMWFDDQ